MNPQLTIAQQHAIDDLHDRHPGRQLWVDVGTLAVTVDVLAAGASPRAPFEVRYRILAGGQVQRVAVHQRPDPVLQVAQ